MLYEKLREYALSGAYPMHMPGHKRNTGLLPPGLPYDIDITEIHGFDDLHDPHGLLLEISGVAERLYGSAKAFPLVNGSTVGVLAAIGGLTERGDIILIPGNCHRSVMNAASLFGLETAVISPKTDAASGVPCSISPAAVDAALEADPDIKLVVATSPTYEGAISDISLISSIAHARGIPLFVDSAHGAHLEFMGGPAGGLAATGADAAVMSLHKTLPALTQCSLLHLYGGRADAGRVGRLLSALQTSSPSYVLMSSIDSCLRMIAADGESLFREYKHNLGLFDEKIKPLKKLKVLCHGADDLHPGFFAFDPGKLTIVVKGTALTGKALAGILRDEYAIELELAFTDYAIAMTSICDTAEGFGRLADALAAIDSMLL